MSAEMRSASDPSLAHADNGFIRVITGRFYADAPRWDIRDIAWALPTRARFSGFTHRRINTSPAYSSAQHGALVSFLMQEITGGNPLEGLLHDATDAVLPDVASPWKRFMPDFKAFESRLDTSLRAHFGLPSKKTPECSKADWLALYIEGEYLLPGGTADFTDPYGLREEAIEIAGYYPCRQTPDGGYAAFCHRYHSLTGDNTICQPI